MSSWGNLVTFGHIIVQAIFPPSQCFALQIVSFVETSKSTAETCKYCFWLQKICIIFNKRSCLCD